MVTGPKPRPLDERFWEKVNRRGPGDCWEWLGGRSPAGYGRFTVGSHTDNSRRRVIASRLSYELSFGAIPDGYLVCHTCDNPPCVNPAHLFLGDHKDNMQDALAKGRLRQPASREFCRNGHEMTPDNIYHYRGLDHCRACHRANARASYYRRHEKELERSRRRNERVSREKAAARGNWGADA